MGEVYRADDLRLGQAVALKFLPPGLGRDAQRLAQFHTEVRTARQVSHPNICRVYDIGEAEGQLFLSMEFVDGEDLSASLRRFGRFPKIARLKSRVRSASASRRRTSAAYCTAISSRHHARRPGARPHHGLQSGHSRGGHRCSRRNAAVAAPEQLLGREVTVRSDIFALGLVLYEMFTGRRAFEAKTVNDLISQHESGTIASPSEITRSLDPMVERAIMRCLERDPAKRPGSALAVAASLPGGDPLAAAIAAGETPSPEMVAAAGGESATLSTGQSVVLGTAMVALLVLMAALADRGSVMGRVPLNKPRAVLIDRASELRRTFGYTEPVGDSASGYYYDTQYSTWASRQRPTADKWNTLANGRPAAVAFWYEPVRSRSSRTTRRRRCRQAILRCSHAARRESISIRKAGC